jgi:general secretion pathway protein G
MRAGPGPGSSGFTVIEIVIALAIVGVLANIGFSRYQDYRDRVRVYTAAAEISAISSAIQQYGLDNPALPDSLSQVGFGSKLDPWGHPYEYYNLSSHKGNGKARKDKKLNPLNTDFDLYSIGKDGATSSSLQAKQSRDDVVRARDGRFVGLASDFDP